MPKRTDISSILIIGAGPIVIGQACEFDYSGVQACKALKQEGYRIILVNSNPATIMTDPGLADATYVEPITPEIVAKIIEKERPDALLPTMGGQTALNCALELHRRGVLDLFNVEMIGARAEAIDKAEDRLKFRDAMDKIGLESPNDEGLDGLETRRNWKLKQYPKYEEAVRRIQERGITCNGCFILGLDGQTPSVFDRVAEFADRTSLWDVQITVQTPFPGTPLYARLEREGRLLAPGAWEQCTLFDVNFVPQGMSVKELEQGFLQLAGRLYHPDAVRHRREGFFRTTSEFRAKRA